MARQTMAFSIEAMNTQLAQGIAAVVIITTTWFSAKRKFNKDRVETADTDANISAIGQWQTIVTNLRTDMRETITRKDEQINRLESRNEELTNRNQTLFESNQKLTSEIGGLKNQIEKLTSEVQQLNQKIGGVI